MKGGVDWKIHLNFLQTHTIKDTSFSKHYVSSSLSREIRIDINIAK